MTLWFILYYIIFLYDMISHYFLKKEIDDSMENTKKVHIFVSIA